MKITRFAAFGLAATLVLAACGASDEPDADGGSPGDNGEKPDTGEPQTVTMWVAGGDTNDDMRQWLIDRFAEEHDNATLVIEEQDWNGLVPKLQTALSSEDQTPDIVEVGNTQAPLFTYAGAFEDLGDIYDELGGDKLLPEFVKQGSVDDTVYALPYYSGARAVFYNKEMFDEAGLEVPATLDDFTDVAKKLQDADPSGSGFYLPGQDWYNGIAWLFTYGGDIAIQNGDTWEASLSSPESLKGLEVVADLFANATSAPKDSDSADPWVQFNEGDAAMFSAPTWARWSISLAECVDEDDGEAQQECNESKTGIFPLPGLDAGTPGNVFAGGSNIGIGSKSQNKDLAKDVLRLIFSDEYQNMLGGAGMLPANTELSESLGTDVYAEAAIVAALNAKLTPASDKWADVEAARIMEDFFQQLAVGTDVKTAAEEADSLLNEALS